MATLVGALILVLTAAPVLAQEEGEEAPEPNWVNELGLSYVGTSGNTDTTSFGLDFKSERKPTPWGLNLIATFTRAEDSGKVTAEQYLVGARAVRELSERWSVFAGLSWARDTFSGFENRYIAEVGAEYLAIKTAKHTLSFDAGLTWTSEDQIMSREVDPPVVPPEFEEYIDTVDWLGGVAGLTWDWAFSSSASLSQRVLYYPNFDDTSDWRLGSDTAIRADLTKLLALQFSYLVRYRNQPIDDREKTDTTTKVSVVMSF
jgi:putative salt-induced outer membrane protein YdiY